MDEKSPINANAWPIIGYAARRTTSLVPVLFFSALAATLALHFSTGLTITNAHYYQTHGVAPINAQEILGKCQSLRTTPIPPAGFKKREVSDRYEPGTNATWIRNCRILTGERNGSVVIDGDLFLDKGVVKAIGKVPWHLPDNTPNVTVIDAEGAWITPGLGE